jgi:hypothetical protein
MTESIDTKAKSADLRVLQKSVEHFSEPDFALIPHTKPFWRRVYTRFWIAPVVLLLIITTFTVLQVRESNQLSEENPNIHKTAWRMLDMVLLKNCKDFSRRGPYFSCLLSHTRDINENPEFNIALKSLLEFSEENRVLDFDKGKGSFFFIQQYYLPEHYREYLTNLESYQQAIERVDQIREFDPYLADDLVENSELYQQFYHYKINNSESELFFYVYTSELNRAESIYGAPGIGIELQEWSLDYQDQFHAQYMFTTLYDNQIRMLFILFFALSMVVVPVGVILFFTVFLMNHISKRTPQAIYQLIMEGHLLPKDPETDSSTKSTALNRKYRIRPSDWRTYIHDLEMAITESPWRVILYCALSILLLSITIPVSIQGVVFEDFNSTFYKLFMSTLLLLAPPVFSYIISQYIWVLFVTARFLTWLPKFFDIHIDPDHEDGSGDLKPIGDLILLMVIILLPFVALAVVWIIPDFFSIFGLKAISILFIILPTLLILLIFLMFLRPLTAIHIEMRSQKYQFQNEGYRLINNLKKDLRILAMEDKLNSAEGQTISNQLNTLEKIYAPGVRFPTWPFSTRARLGYLAAQTFQLISFGIGIFELWKVLFADRLL